MATPRVVVVHRRTEYDDLIARHGTRGQAEFFLATRQQDLSAIEQRHAHTQAAMTTVSAAIPPEWSRAVVEREDLSRFVFRPEDIIVVVGQDGLVANLAKYVHGQPVIGIDPLPGANAGVLVPHPPEAIGRLLAAVTTGAAKTLQRTMVQAVTDDGQSLTALNEIYVGQPTHQSARYTLDVAGRVERQSSSGIIVGTGTGSTGWCLSLQQVQAPDLPLPAADGPVPGLVRARAMALSLDRGDPHPRHRSRHPAHRSRRVRHPRRLRRRHRGRPPHAHLGPAPHHRNRGAPPGNGSVGGPPHAGHCHPWRQWSTRADRGHRACGRDVRGLWENHRSW